MEFRIKALSIHELGQRDNQEDSIYPPLSQKPANGKLFILCDGMGGHAAGEVASQTVCETMSRYILEHPREDGYFDEDDFNAALNAAYDALDAKDTDDEKKMGTTLTFVKFHAGGCFIAHIGDSRIYHIRPSEKRLLHVTRDHSLVNDLVKLGELTPEEAKTSRQKNVITRAVQPNQESRTKADCLNITDLKEGDYFYMCSDGMLEQAEDEEIVNTLSLPRSDAEKIKILIGATQENKDNHSAHLIRIDRLWDKAAAAEPEEKEVEIRPVPPSSVSSKAKNRSIYLAALVLVALALFYFFRHKTPGDTVDPTNPNPEDTELVVTPPAPVTPPKPVVQPTAPETSPEPVVQPTPPTQPEPPVKEKLDIVPEPTRIDKVLESLEKPSSPQDTATV